MLALLVTEANLLGMEKPKAIALPAHRVPMKAVAVDAEDVDVVISIDTAVVLEGKHINLHHKTKT
jgi:hypothetical protein